MMRLECLHVENLLFSECMAGFPGNKRQLVCFLDNVTSARSDCENKCICATLLAGRLWFTVAHHACISYVTECMKYDRILRTSKM